MTKQITFADEFYALPPSERTKANLQKLFEKYQKADVGFRVIDGNSIPKIIQKLEPNKLYTDTRFCRGEINL